MILSKPIFEKKIPPWFGKNGVNSINNGEKVRKN
jgi:hypothetical protein